jgi:hypothetical protein
MNFTINTSSSNTIGVSSKRKIERAVKCDMYGGKRNATRCQSENLRESLLRDISIDGRLLLKLTLIRV